jgi:hypothetical protein
MITLRSFTPAESAGYTDSAYLADDYYYYLLFEFDSIIDVELVE